MDGKLLKGIILKQVLIIGKSVKHLTALGGMQSIYGLDTSCSCGDGEQGCAP